MVELQVLQQVVGHHQVREVAHAAHHPLLHRPRVRPHLQHVEIVVGFEQQQIRAPQMKLDGFGNVAEIGRHADAHALRFEAEAHRIDGIVRNAEALHFDVADLKAGAGLERLQARVGFAPIDGRRGEPRQVDGRRDIVGCAPAPAGRRRGRNARG